MWVGILIALIFCGAGVAVALNGLVWLFKRRNPAIGLSMMIPSVGFLYFFSSFAAPTLWIVIMGDPNVSGVSADARKLTQEELVEIFEGQIHDGRYYDDSDREWYHYEENYLVSGNIRGKGGPDIDPTMWSWSGQWSIEEGQSCTTYGGDFDCNDVYFNGEVYEHVEDGDVVSWFVLAEPKTVLEQGSERILADTLPLVIEGMAHEGAILGADDNGWFRMVFFGDNHAIYTQRGSDPENLKITEYGWYRFDLENHAICLSDTLGTNGQCFDVWKFGDSYNFVETGVEVTLKTNLVF